MGFRLASDRQSLVWVRRSSVNFSALSHCFSSIKSWNNIGFLGRSRTIGASAFVLLGLVSLPEKYGMWGSAFMMSIHKAASRKTMDEMSHANPGWIWVRVPIVHSWTVLKIWAGVNPYSTWSPSLIVWSISGGLVPWFKLRVYNYNDLPFSPCLYQTQSNKGLQRWWRP